MEKYVILRAPSVSFEEFGPGLRARTISRESEIDFQTAELSKRDIRDLHRDPDVVTFAPVMMLKLVEPVARNVPVPPETNETWGVRAVRAHQCSVSGQGVKVAVLDTGIDANHPAFQGVNIVQKDFTGEGDGDKNGHGTHCAATIFGRTVDGLRVGIAPGIEHAFIGKVLRSDGGGATDNIADAILWAMNCGANVISMSLGMDYPGYVEHLKSKGMPPTLADSKGLEAYRANINLFSSVAEVCKRHSAFSQGVVIVTASGNESRRDLDPNYEIATSPPGCAEGIYSVGALQVTTKGLAVADWSNTKVNVSAPGVNIVSARAGGGVTAMSGTSMAAPHVAGVAALWACKLLCSAGRIDATALAAKLVASGTYEPLARPFDELDVGTGIVQAPS